MNQVTCPKCGYANRAGAQFCKECGGPLGASKPVATPKQQSGRIALVVAIISLLFNVLLLLGVGLLLWQLFTVQRIALKTIDDGLARIAQIEANGLSIIVPVSQTLQIDETVPIQQDLEIPIETTVPIDTEISVLVTIPVVGQRTLTIPIQTSVPVNMSVPVHLDTEFALDMPLDVQLDLPIYMTATEPPLNEWLPALRTWLETMRRNLGGF